MPKLIAFSGKAGVGKDTAASFLLAVTRVALADEMKRICKQVFDFSDLQLWGPSEHRNKTDRRYVRLTEEDCQYFDEAIDAWHADPHSGVPLHEYLGLTWFEYADWVETRKVYLSPRYALQQLGTEWGRQCHENVWVDKGIRIARSLLKDKFLSYTPSVGVWASPISYQRVGVAFTDIRFPNEVEALRAEGAYLVRIIRPDVGDKTVAAHASEAQQDDIPNEAFSAVVVNDGTIEEFEEKVRNLPGIKELYA